MYTISEKSFYFLSSLALMAALFVLQPNGNNQVADFQSQIGKEFQIASIQVFGDQPVLTDVRTIISGVNDFYQQSADAMLALLTPTAQEGDLNQIVAQTYHNFRLAFEIKATPQVAGTFTVRQNQEPVTTEEPETVPDNFMQEPPINNLIPDGIVPNVSFNSENYSGSLPQVSTASWTNMRDSVTGQVYCVAIFNAEVNRYLGPCKNDYQ